MTTRKLTRTTVKRGLMLARQLGLVDPAIERIRQMVAKINRKIKRKIFIVEQQF